METTSTQLPELSLEEVKRQAAIHNEDDRNQKILQLIIFRLAGEEYALHIDQVKEIVLTPGIAKMPHTPDYIRGVANIRGTIIAIMDLERKFDLEEQEESQPFNYTLVIESETHKVGLLSRTVPSTLSVKASQIDRNSSIIQYSSLDEDAIDGIVKVDDRLIMMVNIHSILKKENLGIVKI
jgi:purine-binding chemotaxis protein CheW